MRQWKPINPSDCLPGDLIVWWQDDKCRMIRTAPELTEGVVKYTITLKGRLETDTTMFWLSLMSWLRLNGDRTLVFRRIA